MLVTPPSLAFAPRLTRRVRDVSSASTDSSRSRLVSRNATPLERIEPLDGPATTADTGEGSEIEEGLEIPWTKARSKILAAVKAYCEETYADY
jgi:hypothetical protein